MNQSNLLEVIPNALGGDDGLRRLRDTVGIPSFCYKSPIGWIDIITEENRISSISFSKADPSSEPTVPLTLPVLARTIKLLDTYFAGSAINFAEIPVQVAYGTEFQQHVWKAIQQIPYGEVRSYQWIANQIGRPKSARPIGNAVGANPVSILIPCHRVIRSNGALGGYGGGLERKRQLLALEGQDIEKLK